MVTLLIGNSSIKVDTQDRLALSIIKQACSYEVAGAKYTVPFQKKVWDGRKSVFDGRTKMFPSGLLYQVAAALQYNKIPFTYQDKRYTPEIKPELTHKIELRDYQLKAVEDAVKVGRGTIHAPTGSGKTLIAIALACKIGVNFLILTNRRDMLYQLKEEVEKWTGRPCGIIRGKERDLRQITVATIQTLSAQVDSLDEVERYFEGLIVDEYHHSASNSYLKILKRFTRAFYRYGFTATPFRNDDASKILAAISGRVIHTVSKEELERLGFLVPAHIKMLNIEGSVTGSGYEEIYSKGIVNNEERNSKIIEEANKLLLEGQRVLILVSRVAHGEYLSQVTGWQFIQGNSSKQIRTDARDSMRIGDLNVLIATGIFDEGIDIPSMSAVIFGGAGKSKVSVVQRVGRSLRPFPGKKHSVIIDFMDKQSPMLEAQSYERLAVYNRNGWKTDLEMSNFFC